MTVGISGTGGGFQRFCKGETDLQDASRPMRISEAQSCKSNNVGSWRAFTVANDALTVVVNRQNTWASCLSVDELKKIWEPGSKVNNKALQIRNPKTGQCVAPSVQSAQNNSSKPLARPLFVYAKGSSFKRREVQAFLDFIFDNELRIAQRADFVPLTKAQLKRARTNFSLAVKAANKG